MKFIKSIAIGIFVAVSLMFVISLFLPKQINVSRTIWIQATAIDVFEQVNYLRNWENWSPWMEVDPQIRIVYDGPNEGEGASYLWESDVIGNGSISIIESVPHSRIHTNLNFMENRAAEGIYEFIEEDNGTRVIWTLDSETGNMPWNRITGFIVQHFATKDFEKGLKKLKTFSESNINNSSGIYQVKLEPMLLLGTRSLTGANEVEAKIQQMLSEIEETAKKSGLKNTVPYMVFYHQKGETYDVEATIPVPKGTIAESPFQTKELRGYALVYTHKGGHSTLNESWDKLYNHQKKNNIASAGSPWAVYSVGSNQTNDTSLWSTQLYLPIEAPKQSTDTNHHEDLW